MIFPCRYDVICFRGISCLKSPYFSTADLVLASMLVFQSFFCPSSPAFSRFGPCSRVFSLWTATILPSAAFLTTDSTYLLFSFFIPLISRLNAKGQLIGNKSRHNDTAWVEKLTKKSVRGLHFMIWKCSFN